MNSIIKQILYLIILLITLFLLIYNIKNTSYGTYKNYEQLSNFYIGFYRLNHHNIFHLHEDQII